MIVVDTSVWIDAHRHPSGASAATLKGLLDADEVALALPVRLELMAGVSRRDRAALARGLSSLPVSHPTDETWQLVERWIPVAAEKGHRFALADWVIAALADEVGGLVWSLDQDFAKLEQLKMVRNYAGLSAPRHR